MSTGVRIQYTSRRLSTPKYLQQTNVIQLPLVTTRINAQTKGNLLVFLRIKSEVVREQYKIVRIVFSIYPHDLQEIDKGATHREAIPQPTLGNTEILLSD